MTPWLPWTRPARSSDEPPSAGRHPRRPRGLHPRLPLRLSLPGDRSLSTWPRLLTVLDIGARPSPPPGTSGNGQPPAPVGAHSRCDRDLRPTRSRILGRDRRQEIQAGRLRCGAGALLQGGTAAEAGPGAVGGRNGGDMDVPSPLLTRIKLPRSCSLQRRPAAGEGKRLAPLTVPRRRCRSAATTGWSTSYCPSWSTVAI